MPHNEKGKLLKMKNTHARSPVYYELLDVVALPFSLTTTRFRTRRLGCAATLGFGGAAFAEDDDVDDVDDVVESDEPALTTRLRVRTLGLSPPPPLTAPAAPASTAATAALLCPASLTEDDVLRKAFWSIPKRFLEPDSPATGIKW